MTSNKVFSSLKITSKKEKENQLAKWKKLREEMVTDFFEACCRTAEAKKVEAELSQRMLTLRNDIAWLENYLDISSGK